MAGTLIPVDLDIYASSSEPGTAGDIKVVSGASALTINNCDSTSGWSLVGTSTNGVYFTESTWIYYEGAGSIFLYVPANTTGRVKYTNPTTSWNLDSYNYLRFSAMGVKYTTDAPSTMRVYFGESTYNEQSTSFTPTYAAWKNYSWNISSISAASRNAVTRVAFELWGGTHEQFLYIDAARAEWGPTAVKAYDGDKIINLYPKIYSTSYTGTGSTQRIAMNTVGTPCSIRIIDTTGSRSEILWTETMDPYMAARVDGGGYTTHRIIGVGAGYFDIGTTSHVNASGEVYSVIAMFADTTV